MVEAADIGLVSQEPALFSTTIVILLGRPDASLVEIEEAARVANAHSFIIKLTNSYDTQVSHLTIYTFFNLLLLSEDIFSETEVSLWNVKTAEVGKTSDKGMEKKTRPILNMKLDGNSQESYTSLKRLDMYSSVKMKRRLGGSTQRPFINITSFPKEGPSQLHRILPRIMTLKLAKELDLQPKKRVTRRDGRN
ncbi:hypothetical protein ACET3Z_010515 [Daucus carota]